MDFEALARVSIDDGVGSPPRACGGVILVLHCQVDDDSHGSFLHCGLKLQTKQMGTITILEKKSERPFMEVLTICLVLGTLPYHLIS